MKRRSFFLILVAGCMVISAGCTTFNTTHEQWEAEQQPAATYRDDSCARTIADLLNWAVGASK